MGIEIDRTDFSEGDFEAFRDKLEDNIAAFKKLMEKPGFGEGKGSIGAELEMYIVDERGRPLSKNQEILEQANDSNLTLELNRYNLEYNLNPYSIDQQPFHSTEQEMLKQLGRLSSVAGQVGGRVVPIGILPTLSREDFGPHCMTDMKRYQALVQQLIKRRGSLFKIYINGDDPLQMDMSDITLEGANTSFQVHYQVDPAHYADTFNAFQLMTPLVIALAANSPTLFGHRLWKETRIPLFKQSIDVRQVDRYSWNEPARVHFGAGWVRQSATELFEEVVRIYEPLLPVCGKEDPYEALENGRIPRLDELRLHQSTAWLWNRPIYDHCGGGMLRIEMRALPAGPTALDMVANSAFLIGLAEGIRANINDLLPAIPFHMADYNFYRAAQYGLDAKLVWPELNQYGFREQPITGIIERMLPVAASGLAAIGIDQGEIERYLSVIENRLQTRQTGAQWQLATLEKLNMKLTRQVALHNMLDLYLENSQSNQPVSEWPI